MNNSAIDAADRLPAAPRRLPLLAVVVGVWAAIVTMGTSVFWAYGLTPGAPARAAVTSPAADRDALVAADGRASLVVFVHPQCPCSRATLAAVAELIAARPAGAVLATAVFADVPDGDEPVEASRLWRQASAISGLRLVRDDAAGSLAERFDAHTSGQAFAYDAGGRLAFRGGLTPSRGQFGDSAGRAAAASVFDGRVLIPTTMPTAPVYGCALR